MQEHTGKARNARIAVRLSREDQHQVEQAAKTRGYANSSAFNPGGDPERTERARGDDRH
jgi:hypothetical protein